MLARQSLFSMWQSFYSCLNLWWLTPSFGFFKIHLCWWDPFAIQRFCSRHSGGTLPSRQTGRKPPGKQRRTHREFSKKKLGNQRRLGKLSKGGDAMGYTDILDDLHGYLQSQKSEVVTCKQVTSWTWDSTWINVACLVAEVAESPFLRPRWSCGVETWDLGRLILVPP